MGIAERFMAYAADFEKTLKDDDWSRLTPYFTDDAVYRVESGFFGCELAGSDAVLAGMKKSLDGFDRHFDGRELALTDGPKVEGDEFEVAWSVTYRKGDLPPFVLEGRSVARFRDGRIAELVDSYDEKMDEAARAWMAETGLQLDPSYV